MSYDLMVFRKEAAPRTKAEFMKWYEVQTQWSEDHSYDDPANTSPELQKWFMEMVQTFPGLNGPLASDDDDDPIVTDYSVGRDVIYAAFSWSLAEPAYIKMKELAAKHAVGFFDASGNEGDIFFPENGQLKNIADSAKNSNSSVNTKEVKPWWKIW